MQPVHPKGVLGALPKELLVVQKVSQNKRTTPAGASVWLSGQGARSIQIPPANCLDPLNGLTGRKVQPAPRHMEFIKYDYIHAKGFWN